MKLTIQYRNGMSGVTRDSTELNREIIEIHVKAMLEGSPASDKIKSITLER